MLCARTILAFITAQTLCTRTLSKRSVYKNIEDDIEKLKAKKVRCTEASFEDVLRLKCEKKLDIATLCIAEVLLANTEGDVGELWTHLGEIYHKQGKSAQGNKCFKEAAKLNGRFTGQIKSWDYIGPFQIGKTEVDGDPLEAFGGIDKLLCERYNKRFQVYSEQVPKGKVNWHSIDPDESGNVTVPIDLHRLAEKLFSIPAMDWQGWLVGDFILNVEMTVLIQCIHVSTIYVDGAILAGDLYHPTRYWHPIHLKPGVHSVLLRARSSGYFKFFCRLKPADQAPSFQTHPPVVPDLVNGRIFSNLISIPLTNHSPTKWLKITTLTLVSQTEGPDISLHLDKKQRLIIAPGQIHSVVATFAFKDDKKTSDSCSVKDIRGVLQLKSSEGFKDEISFTIRCRRSNQSFLFTFIDHDGSIQTAAAIFPIVTEEAGSVKIYPVLLTLHSTGIAAQDHADAYKRKNSEKEEFIFGVEKMWVLAPTRHGAHNWEGPGERTAMTSLQRLAELTREHDWISTKANSRAVVFSGHSTGGHGAWELSIHHPDITLAVVSIAGWMSKENYACENAFFKHDISASHIDASVKHVMESCILENDAERHVSNLKGIPVLIRTGESDDIVLPYFSKRMYRLLKEQGNDVKYNEVRNKGHWWWDTKATNDGGIVNDVYIRKFLAKYSEFAIQRTPSPACSKDEECEDGSTSKYFSAKVPDRNIAGSGEFLLTVYNPASSQGVRGTKVIQQVTPFRKTTVRMKFTKASVTIVTSNVIRLRLTEPAISPVFWTKRRVIVDGVEVSLDKKNEDNMFEICKEGTRNWKSCEDTTTNFESETQRGPLNLGPARHIAERPFLIVVGTARKSETTQALLQMAVYIANTFYLTSNSIVPITRDKDAVHDDLRDRNLIIVGETSFALPYLEKTALNIGDDHSISLGNCIFQPRGMGVLSLVPHTGSRLALVITGTSLSSIRDVISLATPTIPPMARSPFSNHVPDYVITGPDFRAHGPGGYLCAGFWGNGWEYRSDISSCAC